MANAHGSRLAALLAVGLALGGCAITSDTDPGDTDGDRAGDPADPTETAAPETPDVDVEGAQPEEVGPVEEATLGTAFGPMPFKYRVVDGVALAEGDVIVPPENVRSATMIGRHWLRGVVPYVIDVNLPLPERITQAIAHWEWKTKMRFVPRTTERDYVHFRSHASACSSNIGAIGDVQFVNIQTAEDASTVAAVGIDRSATPAKVHFYYKRGFATTGSPTRAAAIAPHFRYYLASGKSQASLVEVGFAKNGHLFAWYSDGTVSEGDATDFSVHAPPKPYVLAPGKKPTDVAAFAIDGSDRAHAFYTDGTFSVGTVTNLASIAPRQPFAVAPGKTAADLAHVDVNETGAFVAFYNHTGALQTSAGTAASLAATSGSTLGRTGFPGHCSSGSTVHEIGHAVGLFHEQTRHDRDEHIRIVWENITDENRFNFEKHSRSIGADTGPYDFGSIMHYGPYAFSKNGQRTMVRVNGESFQEQRRSLSPGDVAAITAMYGF